MKFFDSNGNAVTDSIYPAVSGTKYLNVDKTSVKNLPVLYNRKEDCCGCFACYSICPKRSIKMIYDVEGFYYPVVDVMSCISCLRCEQVCPIKGQQ